MSTGLLGFESVEQRQGGVGNYLSPSRLNCWLRCPLAFRLTYIDGIRQPTTPSLFLGRIVHIALETLYRHRQLGVILGADEIARRLVEGWGQAMDEEGMTFGDSAEEQALQGQAVDLVAAYLRQMPADEPKPLAVEVAVEPRWSIPQPAKTSVCRWSASWTWCWTNPQDRWSPISRPAQGAVSRWKRRMKSS